MQCTVSYRFSLDLVYYCVSLVFPQQQIQWKGHFPEQTDLTSILACFSKRLAYMTSRVLFYLSESKKNEHEWTHLCEMKWKMCWMSGGKKNNIFKQISLEVTELKKKTPNVEGLCFQYYFTLSHFTVSHACLFLRITHFF